MSRKVRRALVFELNISILGLLSLVILTSNALAGGGYVYAPVEVKSPVYVVPSYLGWAIGRGETTRLTPRPRVVLEVRVPQREVARALKKKRTVTLLFPFDKAYLTPEARNRLATVPSGARVMITGYTDDIGPSAYNLNLSRRRAESAASYLKKRGVAVLRVTGKGECCLIKKGGEVDRRASRRAVVEER